MKQVKVGGFPRAAAGLTEPVEIVLDGKVLGTYFPEGTRETSEARSVGLPADGSGELPASLVPPGPPEHPDVVAARAQRQLDQAAAQRKRDTEAQHQRDEWLAKAFPGRKWEKK